MAMIECVRCEKVFVSDKNTNICPDCLMKENEDLKTVTDYLRDFPLANIIEVSRRTGVDAAQIFRFVKYGSLKIVAPPEAFKCRLCGKEVKKGTLCQECIDKVGELKEAQMKSEKARKKKEFQKEQKRRKRR